MNRLLAFMLVLLIGSPNCWCCMSKPAKSGKAEVIHSCCQSAAGSSECPLQNGKSDSKKQKDDCRCDLSKTKREFAKSSLQLPAPALSGIMEIWTTEWRVAQILCIVPALPAHDNTGPPHERQPLFQLHCALLL